jgi:replication factor A1
MNQNRTTPQQNQNFQQQNYNSGNQPNKFGGNQNLQNTTNVVQQKAPVKKQTTGPVQFSNPNVANITDDEFMSFKQLAPFAPFTIKARVTQKADLKQFTKGTTINHVFSCELVDRDGNDISASFFGEAAEHYFNIIEENKVFMIMNGGTVKMANPRFNRSKSEYQLVFERRDASIMPAEDTGDILRQKFDFTKLSEVQNKEVNSVIDVAVFIKEFTMATDVPLKNGNSKERRQVYVYDDSNLVMELTLWGEKATDFSFKQEELILAKGLRVAEFGGKKTLSNGFSTKIISDLSLVSHDENIARLISWKKNEFKEDALEAVSSSTAGDHAFMKNLYTLDEAISESQHITGDGKGFYDCRVYVQHIKSEGTLYYAACTNQGTCGKKATQNPNDSTQLIL